MRGPTAAYRCKAAASLVLVLAAACRRSDSPDLLYQRLWSMYVAGSLPRTIQAVSREAQNWKSQPHSVWYWKFHLLHAEALLGQGKTKEAAALLQDSVPPSPSLRQMALRREVDLANVYLGPDRQKAYALLDQAEPDVTDPDLRLRIRLMRGVGWLNANQIDRAESEFSAALQSAEAGGNAYRQAQALNDLSLCARRRGRYEEAVSLASQGADRAARAHASMVEAQCHNNLANYLLYLGNAGDASQHLRQAIGLFRTIDARADLMIGSNLLGIIHDSQEDPTGATQSYQDAYSIALELDRKSDAALYAANVALALIKRQQWNDAATWNQRAIDLDRQSGGSLTGGFITRNAARIAASQGNSDAAVRACGALLGNTQKNPLLRWEAYELLAGMDSRAHRFDRANREYSAALAVIDSARALLENPQNRITLLSRLIPFYKEYVDSLVEQGSDAKALSVTESSRARVLAESLHRSDEPPAFDLAATQRLAARTRSSILSFWLAPERSFAWLLDGRQVHRYTLPPDKEIETLIATYRNSVEHSWGDPLGAHDTAGARLWDALLKNIAPSIPHGTRVIVVPDGALHRLNLETLPVPGPNPHYWVEDVEVAIAPSMTLLSAGAARRGPPSLLVMGAPVAVANFEKLPQADAEVAAIQSRFPDTAKAVFTGAAATLSAYRNADPGRFSVIHFAAHAEPNPESPLESAIVLSPDQGRYLLKARDIVGSQLHADLVTISACRSAGARVYAGEGLIGLAWAFLEAGSQSVIAGLWDVNDGSSRILMDQLYAGIAAGQPPAVALHNAQLAVLGGDPRFRKPYFWGPFQAYVRTVGP